MYVHGYNENEIGYLFLDRKGNVYICQKCIRFLQNVHLWHFYCCFYNKVAIIENKYEPYHEKTCLCGFLPDPIDTFWTVQPQTMTRELNFRFRKWWDCNINISLQHKQRQLIRAFNMPQAGFLMMQLIRYTFGFYNI